MDKIEKIIEILGKYNSFDSGDSKIIRSKNEKSKTCEEIKSHSEDYGDVHIKDINEAEGWAMTICKKLSEIDSNPRLELIALFQISENPITWRLAYKEDKW